MLPNSVQITELIWTVGSVPGTLVWLYNGIYSRSVLKNARKFGGPSDVVWAGMTLLLTRVALFISLNQIALGIFGMTQTPAGVFGIAQAPTGSQITSLGWVVTYDLAATSLGILVTGLAWAYAVKKLREGVTNDG